MSMSVERAVDGRFGHGRFGHERRFGQIQVQSRTFWPNTILTWKEALYELFNAFIHTVYRKQKHTQLF